MAESSNDFEDNSNVRRRICNHNGYHVMGFKKKRTNLMNFAGYQYSHKQFPFSKLHARID